MKPEAFKRWQILGTIGLHAGVWLWPFVYLSAMVFPRHGRFVGIGNDFLVLYYKYKVYLLGAMASRHLPFWSPSEGGGFPFYASPFSQMFYPLNLPLVLWQNLRGGWSPLDHQVFTVLGVSIFAGGLFYWLRRVNTNLRAVCFSVVVMSVSFKITEVLRFPNAVHSVAWYPWILGALTGVCFSASPLQAARHAAVLLAALVCLCTAGYPYYVYYTIFLVPPYLALLGVPSLRRRLFGQERLAWRRAIPALAIVATFLALLCGSYLLAVRDLLAQTTDRGGRDFDFSTRIAFTFEDTVGSLVYPPAAQAEGWYFFSITALLILLAYLFDGRRTSHVDKGAAPGEPGARLALNSRTVKAVFVCWFILISLVSFGRDSHLFRLLWHLLPGFSSLRVWGRLNIVLVPILAWLVSIAYASFESRLADRKSLRDVVRFKGGWGALFVSYLVILVVQLCFHLRGVHDGYWRRHFTHVADAAPWFILYGAVAVATLAGIALLSARRPVTARVTRALVCAVLALVSVTELRRVGTRTWTLDASDFPPAPFRFHHVLAESFSTPRVDAYGTISNDPVFNVGIVDNWYFERYVDFRRRTENEGPARPRLLGMVDGARLFFTREIAHPTVTAYLADADRCGRLRHTLVSFTGDELRVDVDAPEAGYVGYIDNWAPGWEAFVDDQPAPIHLLLGTFKAVQLSAGPHHIRFAYSPPWPWR